MSSHEYDILMMKYSRGEVMWEELVTILKGQVTL